MYEIKNLLVTLDLSEIDKCLISYAMAALGVVEASKITFIHVTHPDTDLDGPATEGKGTKKEEIASKIEAVISPIHTELTQSIPYEILILAGDPITEVLNASKELKVDLIIVGRKSLSEGSGTLTKRLARRALCSVLSVTENAKPILRKILVPIDFSEYSILSLERALDLARKVDVEIVCLNVYTLPQGYTTSGKSPEEFSRIMEKNAEKRYHHFIKQFETVGLNIHPRYQLDTQNAFAKIIFNVALVEDADLIIIGSRGRTNIAAAFLGSTTEKLLVHNISIPTLVLKSKKQNLGFFDALLKI